MNIIEKLSSFEDFSVSEKAAAEFIIHNIDLCLRTSVEKIGTLSYTSGSTVSRVIKKMGFDNFGDFKVALARDQDTQRLQLDVNVPFSAEDDNRQVIGKMKDLYLQSVSDVTDVIDEKQLMETARLIVSSREISLYGRGPSYFVCEDFVDKLRRINIKAYCFTSFSEMWTQTHTQNENDLAIFVSFYGRWDAYIKLCEYMKKKKMKVITITGVEDNPLSQAGSVNICCRSKEKYDKIASFESRNEMMFVLDLLFCFVFRLDYEGNLGRVRENMDRIYAVRNANE